MSRLGDEVYGWFQIKIWLQRFKGGDFPCKNLPRPGRSPLTLGPQFEVYLQKYLSASAWMIAKSRLTTVPPVREIPRENLGKKILAAPGTHWLSPLEKIADIEASRETLRILQDSKVNYFDGTTTGDESWFQYLYSSSEICFPVRAQKWFRGRGRHSARWKLWSRYFSPEGNESFSMSCQQGGNITSFHESWFLRLLFFLKSFFRWYCFRLDQSQSTFRELWIIPENAHIPEWRLAWALTLLPDFHEIPVYAEISMRK
jgi:hypothetical protein